jgi:hypothetical protein
MVATGVARRPLHGLQLLRPAGRRLLAGEELDRSIRRRVYWAWGLLFLNVVPFFQGTWNQQPLIIHIPSFVGKIVTQGALGGAFFLALSVNRRLHVRPNVFLCLLSLLVVGAAVSAVEPAAGSLIGTTYRTCRLAGFVGTAWLLSPLWDRRDLLLVKCHLAALFTVLGTVVLGALIAPGRAFTFGRLSGELWPITPVQVSDYTAIALGIIVVFWFCGVSRRRRTVVGALFLAVMLYLTHTRTELVALAAGLLVAGLRMFAVQARVRRLFMIVGIAVSVAIIGFSSALTTWLARGESTQELDNLTGRTIVWAQVLSNPRDRFQLLFGYGLSNKGFHGLPIDSTWIAGYYDLGLIGVSIVAALLLFVLVTAYFRPRGIRTSLALFIVTYLVVASYTETGVSDASYYLLALVLAASLLTPPRGEDTQLPSGEWLSGPAGTGENA